MLLSTKTIECPCYVHHYGVFPMLRTILLTATIAVLLTATIFAETTKESKPNWTFTEEQLRLFNPPLDADAEKMLEWTRSLESPIPKDTKPYGGFEKYREHVQLMRIMVSRAILATNPPFELEKKAWQSLWFPYYVLSLEHNQSEWLPKWKTVYDELTELSRKKGDIFDQQTILYLNVRGKLFFRHILELDKNFLSQGEIVLGEIDNFMKKHRALDSVTGELYDIKISVLETLSAVDEKYKKMQADFKAEMKTLFLQNEDRVQSPFWFHLLYPDDTYDTPEKQAEAYRLIEKFQKLIDTNEETKRFDAKDIRSLYNHQITLFSSLIYADLANIPKLQAYLDTLEKKNNLQLKDILYGGYHSIWNPKLHAFSKNGGSNDDLTLIFDAMMKFLDIADNYDGAGSWLSNISSYIPAPFEQCTPEQQALFMNRMEQVIAKMEAIEKAWKDAGKPMNKDSYVDELRNYIDFLRMPGTVVALTGKTVDGKPVDIKEYRGKVVVLHFWATWCGPCIRRIPLMKELYAQYHDRGFEVLGISYDFEPETIQPFIDKHKLPYLSLFDKDREILSRFSPGNSSIDCLFDREGKAVFYKTDEELKEKLKELFP